MGAKTINSTLKHTNGRSLPVLLTALALALVGVGSVAVADGAQAGPKAIGEHDIEVTQMPTRGLADQLDRPVKGRAVVMDDIKGYQSQQQVEVRKGIAEA
ncbi:hypothetical protein [Pseudactinotalea terrae]|uniref:hypothetical protein n=1 Tax=Pseudactinotalea terrae TaxID=1743262 RepID=UPI0012E13541|nr:hypothetical protein [Pseudactinotalea terrae]